MRTQIDGRKKVVLALFLVMLLAAFVPVMELQAKPSKKLTDRDIVNMRGSYVNIKNASDKVVLKTGKTNWEIIGNTKYCGKAKINVYNAKPHSRENHYPITEFSLTNEGNHLNAAWGNISGSVYVDIFRVDAKTIRCEKWYGNEYGYQFTETAKYKKVGK